MPAARTAPPSADPPPPAVATNLDLFEDATRLARLQEGWERVQANAGAAGSDGVTVARFAGEAASRLLRLHAALRDGSYRPGPLRRVDIPKQDGPNQDGGLRPLAIPCVVDRVAQSAAALTLGPVLEDEMEDESFGYRPGRSISPSTTQWKPSSRCLATRATAWRTERPGR